MALNDILKSSYTDGYKQGQKDMLLTINATIDKLKELRDSCKLEDGVDIMDVLCNVLKEKED